LNRSMCCALTFLIATMPPSFRSLARYTSPMPPLPSWEQICQWPRVLPIMDTASPPLRNHFGELDEPHRVEPVAPPRSGIGGTDKFQIRKFLHAAH
jgi:hypothetical protein